MRLTCPPPPMWPFLRYCELREKAPPPRPVPHGRGPGFDVTHHRAQWELKAAEADDLRREAQGHEARAATLARRLEEPRPRPSPSGPHGASGRSFPVLLLSPVSPLTNRTQCVGGIIRRRSDNDADCVEFTLHRAPLPPPLPRWTQPPLPYCVVLARPARNGSDVAGPRPGVRPPPRQHRRGGGGGCAQGPPDPPAQDTLSQCCRPP